MRDSTAIKKMDETTMTKSFTPKTEGKSGKDSQDENSAVQMARDFYENQAKNSNLSREILEEIPRFGIDEIVDGKVLGTGGFCSVNEVKGFHLPPDDISSTLSPEQEGYDLGDGDPEVDSGEVESRKFIAKHCYRSNGDARYAVKILKQEILSDKTGFLNGIVDLASETDFLAALEHPNIIKLRGIAFKETMFTSTYFLILDRLYDTLESRIPKWKARKQELRGIKGCFKDPTGQLKQALEEERMESGLDLAAAVAYLHKKKIIHRDLKSENIGFDVVRIRYRQLFVLGDNSIEPDLFPLSTVYVQRGDIKIFDLGLAKEIPKDALPGTTFNFTACCGTPR
jgi:serine/threonine protein kinase